MNATTTAVLVSGKQQGRGTKIREQLQQLSIYLKITLKLLFKTPDLFEISPVLIRNMTARLYRVDTVIQTTLLGVTV